MVGDIVLQKGEKVKNLHWRKVSSRNRSFKKNLSSYEIEEINLGGKFVSLCC